MHFHPFIAALAAASLVQALPKDDKKPDPLEEEWVNKAIEFGGSTCHTVKEVKTGFAVGDSTGAMQLYNGKWTAYATFKDGHCTGDKMGDMPQNSCWILKPKGDKKRPGCIQRTSS